MDEENAPGTTGRRFGLVDGLIVLGSVAVAFSILWDNPSPYQHLLLVVFGDVTWTGNQLLRTWFQLIQSLAALLAMLLCVASATILALNLRGPRPSLESLACQPGFMASATVMAFLVPGVLLAVKSFVLPRLALVGFSAAVVDPRFLLSYLSTVVPTPVALAILASWFTLKLTGRWSPQPNWLDRAGRAVAWAWLIVAIL